MLSPELFFLLHQQRHQEMVQQAEYARPGRSDNACQPRTRLSAHSLVGWGRFACLGMRLETDWTFTSDCRESVL